ncbi:hypothetical protein PR048_020973, partial [Dryococelus australis]
MKKEERGDAIECVAHVDGVDVSNTLWKDNECVMFLSSYVGKEPEHEIKRRINISTYTAQLSSKITTNKWGGGGGVHLFDIPFGRYRISMRTRKWYMRIFYQLVDIAVTNAWLLHWRIVHEDSIKLFYFRLELARTLCSIGMKTTPKRRIRGPTTSIPPPDARLDQISHLPSWNSTRIRCKFPSCKALIYVMCE